MKLKTYMCTNMAEAMALIRQELGPDAVILSSLNEGDQVRVTAASDNPPPPPQPAEEEPKRFCTRETKNTLCHMLRYHGVPEAVSDPMIAHMCRAPQEILEQGVAALLEHLLPFTPLRITAPATSGSQHLMLAGPVGVGKTVTLTKIATEFRLKNLPVELISTDDLKAGSREQIQAYATALEIPLSFLSSPTQLEKKLADCTPGVTYLIDTAGTNPLHGQDMDLLTQYILASKQAPDLVLAAGGDAFEMQDMAAAFKELGCTRLFMTRFDATKRFGGLLSILYKERLALAGMSCGPEIGNRLKEANCDNVLKVLQAYLPDAYTPTFTEETLSTISARPSHTSSPQRPALPAWVKGYMEAQKA